MRGQNLSKPGICRHTSAWVGMTVRELLNRYTVNSRIVGSNPIPSATSNCERVWSRPWLRLMQLRNNAASCAV